MRLLVSFFLSLLIYSLIVFLFFKYILLVHKKPQKEVLVHTAIVQNSVKYIPKQTPKPVKKKLKISKSKSVKKPQPIKKIKRGSKTNITKGGEIDFNDIFKNVKENVDTTPVKLKKSEEMSRFKGLKRIEKLLKSVKNISVNISYENCSSNKLKEAEINQIIGKIAQVWNEISDIPGEYAKIYIINNNGSVSVVIFDSNLDENKQKALISLIKTLKFDKDFDLNILFQTKVNK